MFKKTEQDGERDRPGRTGLGSRYRAASQEPTPIGPTMRMKGDIVANEDLVVHGHVEGTYRPRRRASVGNEGGAGADADARARVITVEGRDRRRPVRPGADHRAPLRIGGGQASARLAVALDFGCAFSGAIDTHVAENGESFGASDAGSGRQDRGLQVGHRRLRERVTRSRELPRRPALAGQPALIADFPSDYPSRFARDQYGDGNASDASPHSGGSSPSTRRRSSSR